MKYRTVFFIYLILAIPTLSYTKNLSSELESSSNADTSPLPSITQQFDSKTTPILDESNKIPCLVTIFIHGTLKPAEITFAGLQQVAADRVQNTMYAEVVEMMRPNLHFHRAQAMQGIGLAPIAPPQACSPTEKTITCKTGAHCIVSLFEEQYKKNSLIQKNRRYYTFGWNGLLSIKERMLEAHNLYKQLTKEVNHLRSKNLEPWIQLITFSHGGNVALNLAAVKKEKNTDPDFVIEQLILLATPIQRETDFLVCDDLFKKVFLFYSTSDTIQNADVFSTKKELKSKRTFTGRYNLTVPEKLTQIQMRLIKSVGKLKVHKDKPNNHTHYLAEHGIKIKHMDPSHTEFWNIQWGDAIYRPTLPIYPLPVVALIPTILADLAIYCPEAQNISFDYCPLLSEARIIQKHPHLMAAIPFLNKESLNTLKGIALQCKPADYSINDDKKEEQEALRKARKQILENKHFKHVGKKQLQTSYLSLSHKLWPNDVPQI